MASGNYDYSNYTMAAPGHAERYLQPNSVVLSGQEVIVTKPLATTPAEKASYGVSDASETPLLGIIDIPVTEPLGDSSNQAGNARICILQPQNGGRPGPVFLIYEDDLLQAGQIEIDKTSLQPLPMERINPGSSLIIGRGEPRYDNRPKYRTGFRNLLRTRHKEAGERSLISREHVTVSVDDDGTVRISDHSRNGTLVTAEEYDGIASESLPQRPTVNGQLGNREHWRFLGDEWRLTRLGALEVPRTAHEIPNALDVIPEDYREAFEKNWLFDPGGRPRVYHTAQTSGKPPVEVSSLFIVGAAYSASSKPEYHIDVDTYEQFRDGMLKLGQGMAVFGECITSQGYTEADARHMIGLATGRHPNGREVYQLLQDPKVLQYVRDYLFEFGISKYHDVGGDKTSYGASDRQVEQGGRKERTTDDTLEEWLRAEQNYPLEVSDKGRKVLLTVMQSFETQSHNDKVWTEKNSKIVEVYDNMARAQRRNFAGRVFMPIDIALALAGNEYNADELHAKRIHMPGVMDMEQVIQQRARELAQQRSHTPIHNPWLHLLQAK